MYSINLVQSMLLCNLVVLLHGYQWELILQDCSKRGGACDFLSVINIVQVSDCNYLKLVAHVVANLWTIKTSLHIHKHTAQHQSDHQTPPVASGSPRMSQGSKCNEPSQGMGYLWLTRTQAGSTWLPWIRTDSNLGSVQVWVLRQYHR